jgi:peptidoglycan/LPS O-acetylase OafA/YrhL
MTSRPPSYKGKLISLEIARFIAAFCVATDHIASPLQSLGEGKPLYGFNLPPISSVLFFFVLSGFVIFTAHREDFGQIRRVPRYLWLRVCRIYPLYWISLVPMLYFLWVGCSHDYLVHIFNLSPLTPFGFREINPPAWTLRFELSFYFIFAAMLLPYVGRAVMALWLLFIVWQWYPYLVLPLGSMEKHVHMPPGLVWHWFDSHDILFFCGMAAAALYARIQPPARVLWPLLAASGIALVLFVRLDQWGFAYPPASREPFTGLSFAAVIFTLAALERGGHLRLHRRWAVLGAMSYPFYLLHPAPLFLFNVYVYFHPTAKHIASPTVLFLGAMAVALLLTALVTFLYDRPIQRLARRLV